jgi:beta-ribofuranosylaminobenzene 5'-phosphate synthase
VTTTIPQPGKLTRAIRVSAPARLHLGFLDLNGSIGRKFGSIGLAIDSYKTTLTAYHSSINLIEGNVLSDKSKQKIANIVTKFYATLGSNLSDTEQTSRLVFDTIIPEHSGLGSGTQLAIAVGTALCKLHQIHASTTHIAHQLGRGKRSGIGIAAFDSGGFIVDGGLSNTSDIPPLLAQYIFPETWRIVLINDHANQGIHGTTELNAFSELPPFPTQDAQAICHLTLMQLMPAIVEQELDIFGDAITQIQALIGDHFAPAQGGRYTSESVSALLHYANSLGHKGIAQSSWGPTGCIFVSSPDAASQLIEKLERYSETHLKQNKDTSFEIAQCTSHGATIEILQH